MKKHKLIIFLLLLLSGAGAFAQQDPQFSQYMFNGLVLNPAYAGSREHATGVAIFRQQWVGIQGAPQTASLAFHGPSRNLRHGFGGSIVNDRIGVTNNLQFTFSYAYRIPIAEKYWLSLGLQGSLASYRLRNSDVRTDVGNDDAFTGENTSLILPNAGVGAYFNSDRLYVGISMPTLIGNNLFDPDRGDLSAKKARHLLLTGGVVFDLGQSVKMKPSFLMKYAPAAPVQFDLNLHFLFVEKFWIGASYRTGDAIVGMLEWQITRNFRIGYAYDYTLSQLTQVNSGSHEAMLGVDFGGLKKNMTSPRYF